MQKIPLTGEKGFGKFAMVSDEDYDSVSRYTWWLHKYGYAITRINGRSVPMHRYLMGFPKQLVDHRDLDRLDNQRENLRLCSFEQNLSNSGPRFGRKYKGVYKENSGKPKCYHAKATVNGRIVSFGRYYSELEAVRAYDKAIVELRGEFARPNLFKIV